MIGRDVSGVAVDEVNVIPSFSMNQYHTYGEAILVPDYAVVKHPKSLSFAEAGVGLDDVPDRLRRAHLRRSSESG